jgi:hypothetical protein
MLERLLFVAAAVVAALYFGPAVFTPLGFWMSSDPGPRFFGAGQAAPSARVACGLRNLDALSAGF